MISKMKTKSLSFVIASLLLAYPFYLWFTYIDESVTVGSAYGFQIGDKKKDVYESLPLKLNNLKEADESIFIQIKVTDEIATTLATRTGFDVMIEPLFHDVGYTVFSSQNTWYFYINGSFFNSLKLEFCEEKLCKIYRHRKYFELP